MFSGNERKIMRRCDMSLLKYEQPFLHEQQKLKDNIPLARPMKCEDSFLNHSPSPQRLGPTDKTSEIEHVYHTDKDENVDKRSSEERLQLEHPKLRHQQKLEDSKTISAHRAKLEQPFSPDKESSTDATKLLIEEKSHQPGDVSPSEAMLAVDTTGGDMARKRKQSSLNRSSCSKPDVKKIRKYNTGILCSKDDSRQTIEEYFTSLLQRPTLYSYDEDKFQETVKGIPPFTVLYIIVNKKFFEVLHTDISAMIRTLKGMMDSKKELYFMNFLDKRSDYKQVKYNLPIEVRNQWVDKESFIDIKDTQNTESEESSNNVKVVCDNTTDVKTETAETNTNMQIHDGTAMEVRRSTDDLTSTQIGGDLHFKYENGSSLKGIVLTIKTPEANHRLDVTIKNHIDDNLLHINADLQDLHAHVTSTELGSVIITLKVDEGTKLGACWLEKLIKTILSEDIMTSLPVGTRMELNIQASLSLKPFNVDIFETTSQMNKDVNLFKELSTLLSCYGSSILHKLAAMGSPDLILEILKSGIGVNERNSEKETPLHIAAKSGNVGVVDLLMEMGADITSKDCRHHTPLHLAALTGNTRCIELLMKSGKIEKSESKEIPNPDCYKPTNYQIVQGLIDAGADINAKDHDSKTPLHFAALSRDLQILNLLLQYKPDVRCLDSMGYTALHIAVMNNNFKWGIQLAKHDQAMLHITDKQGNTPLHVIGQRTLEKFVSKTRLYFPLPGQDTGETPLQCAAKNGQIKSVYTLLKLGADVDETYAKGRTPLHEVLRVQTTSSGSIEFDVLYARQFIKLYNGQELNALNFDGESPVVTALLRGNQNLASLLIDEGADVNIPNVRGESVLHVLAKRDKPLPESIKTVLAKGVDINAKDKEGNTPLHLAVNGKNVLTSRLLLEEGADVHAVNNFGRPPFDLTDRKGRLKPLFDEYVRPKRSKPDKKPKKIPETKPLTYDASDDQITFDLFGDRANIFKEASFHDEGMSSIFRDIPITRNQTTTVKLNKELRKFVNVSSFAPPTYARVETILKSNTTSTDSSDVSDV